MAGAVRSRLAQKVGVHAFGLERRQQSGLLGRYANALSDSINYFWDRYVLTYGLGDQIALAADLISRIRQSFIDTQRNAMSFGRTVAEPRVFGTAAGIVALSMLVLMIARRRRPIFDLIAHRLRYLGVDVQPSMTVEEALTLLRSKDPQAATVFAQVIELYEEEQFSSRRDRARVADIRKRLTELRA